MASENSADNAHVDLHTLDSIALDFPLNGSRELGVDGTILNLKRVNEHKYSKEETVGNQKLQKRHIDEKMKNDVASEGTQNDTDVTRKRTAQDSIKSNYSFQ